MLDRNAVLEPGLKVYLNQINRVPLLTAQREQELARRLIRENDSAAREEMVVSNLRLVVHLARKFINRGLAMQDLIEEGNIGLIKAVEAFNPERNIRFATYASWWIKQTIKRALINSVPHIHIPVHMVELIVKWKAAVAELEYSLGRPPNVEELSHHMNMPVKKVRFIRRAVTAFRSLSSSQKNEDGTELQEMLFDDKTPAPDEIVLDRDQIRTVYKLLERIDAREAHILRLRYGLKTGQALTLEEVGAQLGLTRERVRQVEQEALRKLSAYLSADRLPAPREDVDGIPADAAEPMEFSWERDEALASA